MRYRSRRSQLPAFKLGVLEYQYSGKWYQSQEWWSTYRPTGYLRSTSFCYDELHEGPPFKTGGPLNLWLNENNLWQSYSPPGGIISTPPGWQGMPERYRGSVICGFSPTVDQLGFTINPYNYNYCGARDYSATPNGQHAWGDVSSKGATAWKKFRPGKPIADAGVFLGELRDVPRMLRTTARGFRDLWVSSFGRIPKGKTRKAADHWLNTQFGWKPFLSDLRKFHKTYVTADAVIQQIRRDNGEWVRRGGTLSNVSDVTRVVTSNTDHCSDPHPGGEFYGGLPGAPGKYTVDRVTSQRIWFDAMFRYWIPNIDSVQWSSQAKRELYGLDVNPALVWELTPWSWLVDWCSNVGDVFSNLDTGLAQNLTAKYAYVMGTTEQRLEIVSKPIYYGWQPTHTWYILCSRKHRVAANPFGFSLSWENLSPRQWSILTALGITRVH